MVANVGHWIDLLDVLAGLKKMYVTKNVHYEKYSSQKRRKQKLIQKVLGL